MGSYDALRTRTCCGTTPYLRGILAMHPGDTDRSAGGVAPLPRGRGQAGAAAVGYEPSEMTCALPPCSIASSAAARGRSRARLPSASMKNT